MKRIKRERLKVSDDKKGNAEIKEIGRTPDGKFASNVIMRIPGVKAENVIKNTPLMKGFDITKTKFR